MTQFSILLNRVKQVPGTEAHRLYPKENGLFYKFQMLEEISGGQNETRGAFEYAGSG